MMGRDVWNRAYAIGNVQHNFQIADYLLYPNDYMKEKMMGAYMLHNTFKGKALLEGYPRNSVFFSQEGTDAFDKPCRESGIIKQMLCCCKAQTVFLRAGLNKMSPADGRAKRGTWAFREAGGSLHADLARRADQQKERYPDVILDIPDRIRAVPYIAPHHLKRCPMPGI